MIYQELKKLVMILEMDYHDYISYKVACMGDNPTHCPCSTDFYSVFLEQRLDCLGILGYLFRNDKASGSYSFFVGKFLYSDRVLSENEIDILRASGGFADFN